MIFFYRFFLGCLKIRFTGEFVERIFNLCAVNQIKLWSAKSENGKLTAFITLKDFYLLAAVIRGTKIRLHIEERYGLPFVVARYKKRPGILIGVVFFLIFLEFMSSFIWVIDINGNEKIENEQILSALEEIGIHEGVLSTKLQPKNDSQRLLLKLEGLAWASLNLEGSKLTVNITEIEETKKEENLPCNLIAGFDGIITKIDIKAGNGLVKVGDTVKKGDVLVSGIIENVGGTRFVHSQGTVTATVRREFVLSKTFKEEIDLPTGKTNKKSVIDLFTLKLPLYLGKEKGEYSIKDKEKQLKLFGVDMPIHIYTREFHFTERIEITKSREQLILELEEEMVKVLNDEKITDYTVEDKQFLETEEEITIKIVVCLQQNIASEEILRISTGN